MSKILDIANEYRKEINRNERYILREMANRWARVAIRMQNEIDALLGAIDRAQKNGETVGAGWLFSLERYRNMRNQAARMTAGFSSEAASLVRKMEQENARLGIDQANEMLHVLAPDSAHWTRVNEKAMESMAGTLADGSPLEQLIREAAGASAQAMEEALLSGIAIGQGVNTIAWNMHKAANIPYERAVRIARTEINRSYRIASHRQYQASNGVVAGYRRMCFKPTACFACLMLDGEFYPIEAGPMDDHPNGKCTPIPVLRSQVNKPPEWETGREWFKEQDEETQRKLMGAGRFDLWKQGMDPRDMVYIKDNPIWGGSPTVRTLEEMGYGIRGTNLPSKNRTGKSSKPQKNKSVESKPERISLLQAKESGQKFDNDTVRDMYKETVHSIQDKIDSSKSLEEQARQAFELRNQYRTAARELMADEEGKKKLDAEHKNLTFEQLYEHKVKDKGLSHEDALHDIIKTASKTNEEFDSKYGSGKK
jgi:hypothetical protein